VIPITRTLELDESEIRWKFVHASGPGGQNVNKVATAVQLRFDLAGSPSLPDDVKERALRLGRRRISEVGILILEAKRFRSQERNRQDAIDRLVNFLRRAAQPPKTRRKTRPTAASRIARRERKRRRGELKRQRKPVREPED
jgi:ribosome-associated protein